MVKETLETQLTLNARCSIPQANRASFITFALLGAISMQAQVPQYIEIEDKVIGPLTIRQFVYLVGGLGVVGLAWLVFRPIVVLVLAPLIMGFAAAAAFYKVNGRPFLSYVAAFIKHNAQPARFTWQRQQPSTDQRRRAPEFAVPKKGEETLPPTAQEQRSKNLFQIAWKMDIGEDTNTTKKSNHG